MIEIVPSIVVLTSKGEPGYDLCDIKGSLFQEWIRQHQYRIDQSWSQQFLSWPWRRQALHPCVKHLGGLWSVVKILIHFVPKQVVFRRILGGDHDYNKGIWTACFICGFYVVFLIKLQVIAWMETRCLLHWNSTDQKCGQVTWVKMQGSMTSWRRGRQCVICSVWFAQLG